MREFTSPYDAVVVGAGLAGLTCAALLAKAGAKVILLEKNRRTGGYAVTYTVKGHRFDIAVQAIGGCDADGAVHQILSKLEVRDQLTFLPCRPARAYYFDHGQTPWLQSGLLNELIASLCEISPNHQRAVETCYAVFSGLMAELSAIAEWHTGNAAFGFARRFPLLAAYSGHTVKQFLDEMGLPPVLQQRITARAGYCMLPPEKLSLIGFACTEITYSREAWIVKGGMANIPKALVSALTAFGGTLKNNAKAAKISTHRGRVTGVQATDGTLYAAPIVVIASAAAPALTHWLDPPGLLPDRYRRKLSAMQLTGSYYIAYYSIPAARGDNLLPNMEISTRQTDKQLFDIAKSYYVLVPSLVDASAAPPGRHCLCLSVPCAPGNTLGTAQRGRYRHLLEQAFQSRFSFPDGQMDFLFDLEPAQLAAVTGNPGGSAYGWAQIPEQSGIRRLNPKTPVPGLFLAGHWTMPGGGIAGVMTSGKLCAKMILNEKNGLRSED